MSKEVPYQGKVYIFPDDATQAEVQQFLASKGPPQPASAPKSVGEFAGNVLTSGGKFLGGMWDAVTNPRRTVEGLTDVLAGGVELMIPGQQKHEAAAQAVIDLYKNRYGSVDKALETAYNDPVGALSDLSMLAGGAGAIAKGAGLGARAANLSRTATVANQVGRALQTAGAVTDPINIVTKPVTGTLSALGRRGGALNPMERAAVDYGLANGIDVPAGTATGNTFVKLGQAGLEHTPGGSMVADAQKTKIANQMATHGYDLARQIDPNAVVPETAGAGVQSALEQKIAATRAQASSGYALRDAAEADPRNLRTVQQGIDPQGNPILETVAMPVDTRQLKADVRPIFKQMSDDPYWTVTRQQASSGYKAVETILNGPDFVSPSQAEGLLSAMKTLAREGEGRSQGIGKHIVPQLQDAIDTTVAQYDPQALAGLQQGRALTAEKFTTQGVREALREEPVKAFDQLTLGRDANINFLRDIARETPGELTKVGRAYLEQLMDTATESGGFRHGDQLYAKWQKLGPETKKLLFQNPLMIENLDKFFLLTKKMAEQVNPSKSILGGMGLAAGYAVLTDPISGILANLGAAGLTKLLYSPAGTKLLLDGLRAPRGSRQAADLIKRAAMLGARSTPPAAAAGQEKQ